MAFWDEQRGLAHLPGGTGRRRLAVGPSGADRSDDDGVTWTPVELPSRGLHTFSLSRDGATGWAAGGRGQVAKSFAR